MSYPPPPDPLLADRLTDGARPRRREPRLFPCTKTEEHCSSCGRRLVLTVEPGLYDRDTGERRQDRWHSCPRYLVPTWKVLLLPGYGYGHESHNADNPLLGRRWR